MKISLQWLKKYINLKESPKVIAELLTQSGLEVTGITTLSMPTSTDPLVTQPDTIFDIDLTPNRADACAHIGVARELRALFNRSVIYPIVEDFLIENQDLAIQVTVADPAACPRYCGIAMQGIQVQPSPAWLKNSLHAIGLKPINNVVDVTNFVMHELGQPLHAFDYDQIVGKKITVKILPRNTSFVTLDHVTRTLHGNELMICDQQGGLCMAGIFGGARAGIQPSTQNLFLESAYFTPTVIRKTSQQHGLKTDAAFRYERGTDVNITAYALKRACLLLKTMAKGTVAAPMIDLYPKKIKDTPVKVTYKNIRRLIGKPLPKATVQTILQNLDIRLSHQDKAGFVALVPPYRVDVTREADIIEEILRIYGYENITNKTKGCVTHGVNINTNTSKHKRLQSTISTLLADSGYYEIYTNSLTRSAYNKLTVPSHTQQNIAVLNPLSTQLNSLRQNLLFSGLEVIAHNLHRQQPDVKIFEFGKIYNQHQAHYKENNRLGIWVTGYQEAPSHLCKPKRVTFQALNSIMHKILDRLGIKAVASVPFDNAVYGAGLAIKRDNCLLAQVGQVHTALCTLLGIEQAVFFVDIDWDLLCKNFTNHITYLPMAKFPAVRRDLSLIIDNSVSFETVRQVVSSLQEPMIHNLQVADVYQGHALDKGKKTYTISFLLQAFDTTLHESIIDAIMNRLMCAFETQISAVIKKS